MASCNFDGDLGSCSRRADESAEHQANAELTAKFQKINWARANVDAVERVLGAPEKYLFGQETFTRDKLPHAYIAQYELFSIFYIAGKVEELRFERRAGYKFRNILGIGSSIEDVFVITGKPRQIVVGRDGSFKNRPVDKVLYKDRDGQVGNCYFECRAKGLRIFFQDYKVIALYIRGVKMTEMTKDLNKVRDVKWRKKTSEPNDVNDANMPKAA